MPGATDMGRLTVRATGKGPAVDPDPVVPSDPPPSAAERDVQRDGVGADDELVTAETTITAPAARVFATLTDPETYPDWLRGCKQIRGVDAGWPEPGSAFHHRVGVWPVHVDDRTEVVAVEPDRRLELLAKARPAGEARVVFDLTDEGHRCRVALHERPVRGPGHWLWAIGGRPLLSLQLRARNKDSLRLLRELVERS